MKWLCIITSLCLPLFGFCQSDTLGAYRPKIVEFSTEQNWNAPTSYQSSLLGNAAGHMTDVIWKVKLAAPIILKKDKLMALQFNLQKHEFRFASDQPYPLFDHFEENQITNVGFRAIYQRKVSENRSIIFFGGYEVKSDKLFWNRNTNQLYLSSTYTVKKNKSTLIGGGIVVGRSLGFFVVAPVFLYEKILTPGWILDVKLPKSVALRHELGPKSYLIGQLEAKSFRYNLTESIEYEREELTFRKADIQISLNYEHEIHDWLWCSLSAGYSKNFRYYLAEPGDQRREAITQINADANFSTKASIFIVPPRKFYN